MKRKSASISNPLCIMFSFLYSPIVSLLVLFLCVTQSLHCYFSFSIVSHCSLPHLLFCLLLSPSVRLLLSTYSSVPMHHNQTSLLIHVALRYHFISLLLFFCEVASVCLAPDSAMLSHPHYIFTLGYLRTQDACRSTFSAVPLWYMCSPFVPPWVP